VRELLEENVEMSNGRYGAGGSGSSKGGSDDFTVATLGADLRSQGREIADIKKVLNSDLKEITKAVTEIKVQMEHLVTKEGCERGRKELADDLKRRMDGDREVTGHNISLPQMWANYKATKESKPTPPPVPVKQTRGVVYWIGVISAVITIVGTVVGGVVFGVRILDRSDRQEQMMQQIIETQRTGVAPAPPPEKTKRR
jgi:hypothetical protein